MDNTVIYIRCEELHNLYPASAAVIDTAVSVLLKKNYVIETHAMRDTKSFLIGGRYFLPKCKSKNLLLLGTIPFHLLIINLFNLDEKGYRVKIDPSFLETGVSNPIYPEEFTEQWGDVYGIFN